ncbi:MAG TPA: glycosyltransferase family 2 protein [Polyangia bacterium]|nr:glycosyltransferase family 2 protein [Polyangia bacterium]
MIADGVSLFFPVYNDERTVRTVADKALALLPQVASRYEIIIVDDGSPDRSGAIADELAREHDCVRVIHHPRNLGYGAALRAGIAACRFEYVCMIDGDDEYEVEDLRRLLELKEHYDLIVTFRYKKIYSSSRIFLSWVYNRALTYLFRTRFRDISTGLRVARRSVLETLDLEAASTFIGAEMAIKAMLKGYRVGEVGIQTFPRRFGGSASTTVKSIAGTVADMLLTYGRVFSDTYDLPANRKR